MNLLSRFTRNPEDKVASLSEALSMSRASESLNQMPARFAKVISQYDSADVDAAFRRDVYNVLEGAVLIAEAMVDETFDASTAGEMIARQLSILSRALLYLGRRPANAGFAIMLPRQNKILGQYNTEAEAERNREQLIQMGASADCIVVPTAVISMHVNQPKPVERTPEPRLDPRREDDQRPIPQGILPDPNDPRFSETGRALPNLDAPLVAPASSIQKELEKLRVEPSKPLDTRLNDLEAEADKLFGKK